MLEGTPIVWVKNQPDAYRMVSDQNGARLEQSKSTTIRVIGTVFFLVMASITTLLSVGIYNEGQSADDASSVSGCQDWQTEIIVGGNPPYCIEEDYSIVIESIEISEDQHIRESTEGWEAGETWTEEYRWEDVDESVVYGFIEGGQYECVRFIPEFVLDDDWVTADIDHSFEYPDWCGSSVENQDTRVYEEGAHPYDDVWMYHANDVGRMSSYLWEHKVTENEYINRDYISKTIVERDRAEWESYGMQSSFAGLFCTVPITLLFLFAADSRPRVFVVDPQGNTIKRRRSGRYPWFSRTWNEIDFSTTAVVRNVREKHHHTAATEDSPAQSWTTYHPGLNVVIKRGQHQHRQEVLFFEDGGDVNVHGQTISDFMAAIGVEFHYDRIHNSGAEMYARPTLQYLAESNGASEWNDHTADFIIGWYYESDPHFIEKYPEAETDPEFMLEPGGNRPYKEMYRRPFYDGAGLTTVRSTEDAQRLLDHVLALRFAESASKEDILGGESNTVVDSPATSSSPPVWKDDETVADDSERKDDGPSGSFWTFDDSQNP